MRALRGRRDELGLSSAPLQAVAHAIERFLQGRVLRSTSVAHRTAGQVLVPEVETILELALDTREQIVSGAKKE